MWIDRSISKRCMTCCWVMYGDNLLWKRSWKSKRCAGCCTSKFSWLWGAMTSTDFSESFLTTSSDRCSVCEYRVHTAPLTYWTLSRMQQLWRFVWPVNKTASTFHICWTCHPRASTIKFLHVIPTNSSSSRTVRFHVQTCNLCFHPHAKRRNWACTYVRTWDLYLTVNHKSWVQLLPLAGQAHWTSLGRRTQGTSITLRMMRAWIFESVTCAWSWAHYVWGLVTVGLLPRRSDPPASWHDLGQTSTDTYDLISVLPCIPSRNPWFAHEPERRAFDTSQLWCQWTREKERLILSHLPSKRSVMLDTFWFHQQFLSRMKRALTIRRVYALHRSSDVMRWRHDVFRVFVRITIDLFTCSVMSTSGSTLSTDNPSSCVLTLVFRDLFSNRFTRARVACQLT